jgi:putative ABC transport system substrate-binding protein
MRRREFITLLGSVAAAGAWPLAARAQHSVKRPLIAVMSLVARERNLNMLDAFAQGMQQLDFIEGRDFELACVRLTAAWIDCRRSRRRSLICDRM